MDKPTYVYRGRKSRVRLHQSSRDKNDLFSNIHPSIHCLSANHQAIMIHVKIIVNIKLNNMWRLSVVLLDWQTRVVVPVFKVGASLGKFLPRC